MAQGRKTGGRKPGSRNKRTLEFEAQMQQAAQKMKEALGFELFEGNALAFLATVYKNPNLPVDMRLDAAGKAARFETPTLAPVDGKGNTVPTYIAYLPRQSETAEEWLGEYGHLRATEPAQKN